jgi:hypothetical protein
VLRTHHRTNLPAHGRTLATVLITESYQLRPSDLEYATPQHASPPVPGPV